MNKADGEDIGLFRRKMRESNPRILLDGLGLNTAEPEGIEPPYPVGYPAFSKRDYYRSSMAPIF